MAIGIGRRQFISVLGGVALFQPFAARAQQSLPVIGILHEGHPDRFGGWGGPDRNSLGDRRWRERPARAANEPGVGQRD
jgi:hypothetical protein